MSVVKEVYLKTWEEFVDLYDNYISRSEPYIFRGQSNSIFNGKFSKWSLLSSFNRIYSEPNSYKFATILLQHLDDDLFTHFYSKYAYQKIDYLNGLSKLSKAYYLQHYGIPTCFMDFTHHPLIALYFAISSIPGTSGATYNAEGQPISYSTSVDRDYLSIYRINYESLKKLFPYKEISIDNFDHSLRSYEIYLNDYTIANIILSLDLSPIDKMGDKCFYNIKAQESCFLLYDSHVVGNKGLIELIDFYFKLNPKVEFDTEIITVYNIAYNSLVPPLLKDRNVRQAIFKYLDLKQLTGKYLFDDIQGLRYDFNFFH